MRRTLRWIARGSLLLVLLIALAASIGYLWLHTSLPAQDGEVAAAGLSAPATIARDRNGVPHIQAQSAEDAYFALGFVHAQDRLWHMDYLRRVGRGRLSEVTGEATVGVDRFMRMLGTEHLARQTLERLDPEVRAALDAYAAGVNAYIDGHSGALPPEFVLLRYEPEPWQPVDSLVWGRLMAQQLSGNWRPELLRARMARRLTPQQLADLWPAYPSDAPVSLNQHAALYPALQLDELAAAIPRQTIPSTASNAWVVDGGNTDTGLPILANDPHLGLSTPGLWYLARIDAPGLRVAGATVPGVPFHLLGHNGDIAWGFTTTNSDVTDLVIERLDPDDPGRYETPDGFQPFAVREEVIGVRGGDDVMIRVRHSRHGPILSDVRADASAVAGPGHVMAMQSTTLRPDDLTPQALYRLNRARDWDEFVDALRDFHAPQQNIFYADVSGNIGFFAPGLIPIRAMGDGFMPVPGWTDEYRWTGFIPFEELPHSLNPADGYIANANNRIVPDDYPYFLTHDWDAPYRAQRLEDLLGQPEPQSLASSAMMQGDVISLVALEMLPLLLDSPAASERGRQAAARLAAWDGAMERTRPEPLIFSAWLRELNRLLFADELGPLFPEYWDLHPQTVRTALTQRHEWCDGGEADALACPDLVAQALDRALDGLAERHGPDLETWRWGDDHYVNFSHPVFGRIPVLRDLVDVRAATDGDHFTLHRGTSVIRDEDNPFQHVHGAGLRAIYDLSDLDSSLFMQAIGQSGNPLSPHYAHFAESWRNLQYIRIGRNRGQGAGAAEPVLTLVPR